MTEMIERVARAIAAQQMTMPNPERERSRYADRRWRLYVDHARAAIGAMREPTDRMADAGCAEGDWPYAGQTWRDMIDVALGEPEPSANPSPEGERT